MAGKKNTKNAATIAEKYALLSVFDKKNIVDIAKTLVDLGYKIISTGGTAKILNENNIEVVPIQEITGNGWWCGLFRLRE